MNKIQIKSKYSITYYLKVNNNFTLNLVITTKHVQLGGLLAYFQDKSIYKKSDKNLRP